MGPDSNIQALIDFDIRSEMFQRATRFVDYELVQGDILEFGVYTGRSLALLSHYHEVNRRSIHKIDFQRKVIGFDSFMGLPTGEGHPRWRKSLFATNHSYHPIAKKNECVTEKISYDLFDTCNLPRPILEIGLYAQILPSVIGRKYKKAAIVHIDCDVYESTIKVLRIVESIFQDGTILLFDDWFNFRADREKGEQRAFWEYSSEQSHWRFLDYFTYATFGKSFIVKENK